MKIVFFGSSHYSVIDAEALQKSFGLTAVVTLSDRSIGRKHILTPNPVKTFGLNHNIPVITADKLDKTIIEQIASLKPDFLVVADYGLILPKTLLALPKYAALNIHHSLLPTYRGPSPAPTVILAGEKISGVSIIIMTPEVDAGDIVNQKSHSLSPDETADSLRTALNTLGGQAIVEAIENYQKGTVKLMKQDPAKVSYSKTMTKQDGYIDSNSPPSKEVIDRMIRAYYPWPNVWTKLQMEDDKWQTVKFLPKKRIQMEGKKPVSYKDFINGYPKLKEKIEKLV